MMKQAKYLALLLLVVFTLPKVYQDIHILKHHDHFICSPVKTDKKNFPEISKSGIVTCFICRFEFTVSNFPDTFFYQIFISFLVGFYIEPILGEIRKFTGFHFSLRAPPLDL